MSENLSWREAVIRVLEEAGEAMHYSDIADRIGELELRSEMGATPANTVSATISMSLQSRQDESPFIRLSRGMVALRSAAEKASSSIADAPRQADETGLINAFGMFWSRDLVVWKTTPQILGQQQLGSKHVDFCQQLGIYLLYEGREVVYVGRTTNQPLGIRLSQHTQDRLQGRWNRFSWFGVCSVSDTGTLNRPEQSSFNLEMLIVTMEALMIEGLEPRQNRKRGDDFRAAEFLQVEDPDISKRKTLELIEALKAKL